MARNNFDWTLLEIFECFEEEKKKGGGRISL